MSLELDHVFLATVEATEVETALKEFGLVFSRRGRHPGQGTANACALFDNAFFEILWPDDEVEINSEVVKPLALWRSAHAGGNGRMPVWHFVPPGRRFRFYGTTGDVGIQSSLSASGRRSTHRYTEGCVSGTAGFHLTRAERPGRMGYRKKRSSAVRLTKDIDGHTSYEALGVRSLLSAALRWFCERRLLTVEDGDDYRMELEWDHGIGQNRREFHSGYAFDLPLVERPSGAGELGISKDGPKENVGDCTNPHWK